MILEDLERCDHKLYNVKIMGDCQMTILPLQLTVEQLGFLIVQFCAVSLETWYDDA